MHRELYGLDWRERNDAILVANGLPPSRPPTLDLALPLAVARDIKKAAYSLVNGSEIEFGDSGVLVRQPGDRFSLHASAYLVAGAARDKVDFFLSGSRKLLSDGEQPFQISTDSLKQTINLRSLPNLREADIHYDMAPSEPLNPSPEDALFAHIVGRRVRELLPSDHPLSLANQ